MVPLTPEQRERHNARRRKTPEPKTCTVCGTTFTPKRRDAKTCSDRCRQRLARSRRSEPENTDKRSRT
jgi:predicted nucleic acid-binding Zn ribbon protein